MQARGAYIRSQVTLAIDDYWIYIVHTFGTTGWQRSTYWASSLPGKDCKPPSVAIASPRRQHGAYTETKPMPK